MISIETKSGLSLEEEIADEGVEVPDEKYKQRFVLMPIDELCKRAKLDNYREHTITGTRRLSSSIKTRGLLEPILFSLNTKTEEISLIDGEGRFWSCYSLDAKYVPAIIYYDVSEEDRIEMKIAANAMKTPIASDDLAVYAGRLRELLQEYKDKQNEDYEKIIGNGRKNKNVTINELAGVMGKNRKTVSNYLVFSRLPEKILGYVRKHPRLNYYSRAVKIGRRIRESEQVEFFDNILELDSEKGRMGNLKFNELLRSRISREPGVLLSKQNGNPDEAGSKIKELIGVTKTAERYAKAFNDFFIYNEEFRENARSAEFQITGKNYNITGFIGSLTERWNWIHSKLDEEIQNKVLDCFSKPARLRFDEEILLEVQRRRQGDFVPDSEIINPVCDKISIIPLERLRSVRNIRTRISEDRINALAQEIKHIGQLKPGLVVDRGNYYQIIYGHTRVKALERAGHKYFKAFVKDISPLEIELLQCHEDLSEQDKPGERARVLFLYYELMEKKARLNGASYTQEDFVRDFKHLASRKSLLNSLRFMELDDLTRNFSILGLVGYGSAIEIGRLEPDKRMDVLYNALVHPHTRDIKTMVDRKLAEENQLSFFKDIPRSYEAIFREFGMQARSPFLRIEQYFGKDDDFSKAICSDEKLYLYFAKFSQQLERVGNTVRDYK